MLERIAEIQGIGLLYQANGKPHTCQKATLVYANNGRGKSTLATIVRSVSTGDAALIAACKTVDGTLPPKVVLQFGSGHKVLFENGAWSERRSELLVFDAEFIGRNVHSGGTVGTDHRKNLLEFALGEAAVVARSAVDKATNESKEATEKVQSFVGQISGHHSGLNLMQFEKLPQVSDIDAKIVDLKKRFGAANNVAAIQAKAVLKVLPEPSFDIDGFFAGLSLSLKDVHADAEKIVKQHIEKLGGKSAESWLSQGRQFGNGSACPFCDQDISSNDLVHAYQTHFNVAYGDLKAKITALQSTAMSNTAVSVIDAFAQGVGVAVAQASSWAEHVQVQEIVFEADTSHVALSAFREFVAELAQKKNAAPTEPLGTAEEKAKAIVLWERVLVPVRSTNTAIKAAEVLITGYKSKLSSDSALQLQQQIQQLEATKRRYEPKVVELLGHLAAARKIVELADKAKKAARDSLESLMTSTLSKYEKAINALLKNFGASFSIKNMSANFRGNAPRSEYGLLLRGKDVALEGGAPSFATALSDGDKRTLAFAFFIASTLDDPKLATRIVVIDDPMCSLDMNRRHHTRTVLKKLHSKVTQLIVLAHDPYFLRDLREALHKEDKTASIAIFKLDVASNNYTDFFPLDIDKECESVYFQHHRLLNEYAAGNGGDPIAVAKAIRPMLEGYFRRRFPGLVPKGLLFGEIIALIKGAVAPNSLCHAQNLADVLKDINDYAGPFHHDPADSVVIGAAELKTFVEKSLDVVHKGTPS